jgi:hypothetical protein
MKMRRASDVDDDPVVLVGGDNRRIVLQRPEGEAFERFGVGRRIGVLTIRPGVSACALVTGMPTRKPAD